MNKFKATLVKTVVFVLGLTPVLSAIQESDNGPHICPPLTSFLTPTGLDAFVYPGMTFW